MSGRRLRLVCAVLLAVSGLIAATGTAAQGFSACCPALPRIPVGAFVSTDGNFLYTVFSNGELFAETGAFHGDARDVALSAPMVSGAIAPDNHGYWLVSLDGGIFSFGSARFFGSMGAAHLNQPVFSMAPTNSGRGYWLVARDGGIFTFGDARFYGSTGGLALNQPIVGITTGPTDAGYRMVARDGGVFSFGDAPFYGSLPSLGLNVSDAVGMALTPSRRGYWIAEADGAVHAFGDAKDFGGTLASPSDPVFAIVSNPTGQGYVLLERLDGQSFGDAPGSGPVLTLPLP